MHQRCIAPRAKIQQSNQRNNHHMTQRIHIPGHTCFKITQYKIQQLKTFLFI